MRRDKDYTKVWATEEEVAEWRRKHPRSPHPYRVACRCCGTRMWLSGIGLGSHRRACKGPTLGTLQHAALCIGEGLQALGGGLIVPPQ